MLALGPASWHPVWRESSGRTLQLMVRRRRHRCARPELHHASIPPRAGSVIAPFEYTACCGRVLDLAIWHVLPDGITLVGGAIVIGAGLYLIERERRAAVVSEAAGLGPGHA
jgi:hypothetical protein